MRQQQLQLPAGTQQVPLPADNLAAGLYLVQTEVGGQLLRATWSKQ